MKAPGCNSSATAMVLATILGDDPGVPLTSTFFNDTRQWQTFSQGWGSD